MDTAVTDKSALRAHYAKARRCVGAADAGAAAAAVAETLCGLIRAEARVVAGYRALDGEIDVSEAMVQLSARGHALCLPVVEAAGMPLFFRRWQPGQALEKGMHGVEVPPGSAPHVMPDAVIVPLLAFDREGYRLGYGAGYYDRTLHALRSQGRLQVIGAAYSLQQAEHLPHDAHDERLDAVVTEKGVLIPALVAGSGA